MLGRDSALSNFDAWESVMHTLSRRVAKRRGQTLPPFEWETPASSCKAVGGSVAVWPSNASRERWEQTVSSARLQALSL